ncbi:glycosyltransferase [Candidatus Parcubacteria bacterium]|nr:glycosyltransferase [Candidatus Parcubacteria bacterium]
MAARALRIAFVTGPFPQFGETFIVNQIADLIDKKINVNIFAFGQGDASYIHKRYEAYNMQELVTYLDPPTDLFIRFLKALPLTINLLVCHPNVLLRAINPWKFGRDAFSLKLLFWVAPFVGKQFDIIHCNYGTTANRYLVIREVLRGQFLRTPVITTFYGFDVSLKFKEKGSHYYDKLKEVGALFFTMSKEMRQRLITIAGFNPQKVFSLPVSVDVSGITSSIPEYKEGKPIEMVSVGRFVEKKGFDDLLRAVAILKKNTRKPFLLTIVGGGPLEDEMQKLAKDLDILDVVRFAGRMQPEEILALHRQSHLYVQTSKTAANGDME